MDFPAYVPAAVREHILIMIGRSPDKRKGCLSLAFAEKYLSLIEEEIALQAQQGADVKYLDSLRRQRAEAAESRDRQASNEDCIRRLAHDVRMRDAFTSLAGEFTDDQQWTGFIYSAWAARQDYSKCRGRLRQAIELKTEIADAATSLAKMIRQFAGTKVNGPREFFSIPEILRQTDSYEKRGYLAKWRAMRCHVLGDMPHGEEEERCPITEHEIILRGDYLELGGNADSNSGEEALNNLRYGWGVAPGFPALLDTVAKAARSCELSEYGMIGAALKTRQSSAKTEYLRAFGNLLTDLHDIALTAPIMRAMATVANVVINMPDVDVTYDDVRKALAVLGCERLGKSGGE